MTCEEMDLVLHGYIDEELDALKSAEVEEHLKGCRRCSELHHNFVALQAAVRSDAPYFRASRSSRQKILGALRHETGVFSPGFSWRIPAAVVSVALLVVLVIRTGVFSTDSRQSIIIHDIVNSHLRSLRENHLVDVPSSDQHTVKPWFDGKIDYSPTVKNLDSAGFVLVGGRIDFVDTKPVAVIVYKRRLHIINLFTWPRGGVGKPPSLSLQSGYNLVAWNAGEMAYLAISDVAPAELQTFKELMEE